MNADLLGKVMTYASEQGITGKSLREIAAGVGTSHRMLLYHFGSREGLMAAIVEEVERRQREFMAALTERASTPTELMLAQWERLSGPQLRPFVRLFFEVFGVAVQGAPGTEALLRNLTTPWLEESVKVAKDYGYDVDPAAMRIGVAVSRGLLLDLLAGADPKEVTAAYKMFVKFFEQWVSSADVA
jgi:AcrR family transcriptional regulator